MSETIQNPQGKDTPAPRPRPNQNYVRVLLGVVLVLGVLLIGGTALVIGTIISRINNPPPPQKAQAADIRLPAGTMREAQSTPWGVLFIVDDEAGTLYFLVNADNGRATRVRVPQQ